MELEETRHSEFRSNSPRVDGEPRSPFGIAPLALAGPVRDYWFRRWSL